MTVTTDTTGVSVTAPETVETAKDKAVKVVQILRERLHESARAGRLTDEYANGIATGLVSANVVLDPVRALILFARAIEDEAARRRTDPVQDCGNPMGQTNTPSCAELVLRKHEDIAAARLADDLVIGPWPLF